MPVDRKDLQARLAVATEKDTVKGSLINGVCGGLERMLGAEPRAKALLARHRKPLWMEFTNHPVQEFLTLVHDAADLLEPLVGDPQRAITQVGSAAGQAFLDSVVGRVAVKLAAGKEPIDILAYGPATYAPSASYGERTFERISRTQGIFKMRREFMPPAYHLGVLPRGVQINHHRCTIEPRVLGLLDADYLVTWDGQPARPGAT